MRVEGKVAIKTGAGGGIGGAIVESILAHVAPALGWRDTSVIGRHAGPTTASVLVAA